MLVKKPFTESNFQSLFTKFLETDDICDLSYGYELKKTNGATVAFSKFEDQQLPSLLASKMKSGLHHKLTDASMGMKPLDGFVLKNCEKAFVGICFHAQDEDKRCYWFMDIDDVIRIYNSGAKSIKLDDCKKYGFEWHPN